MILTFVLCGGQSTRFGSDKALARLAEYSVLEHVVHSAHNPLLLVDRPNRYSDLLPNIERIVDHKPGRGPASAMVNALSIAKDRGAQRARFVSCDMPTVDPQWWPLLDSVEPAAAFFDTRWHPLLSSLSTSVELAHDFANAPAWRLLEAIEAQPVPPPKNFDELISINTPEDLNRARAVLENRRQSGDHLE